MELGEMHALNRAEVAAVKQAISCREDTYRDIQGKRNNDHPRQGSLIGTTNQTEWAQDSTGNRRFWPVRCGRIDREWLIANRDQLFAEAVRDVHAGRSWHEVPQEVAEAEQEARYQRDLWEDVVQAWLGRMGDKRNTTVLEIATQAFNKKEGDLTMSDQKRIASCLAHLGWEKYKTMGKNRWRLPETAVNPKEEV
jgi:predicted P-loop ATPase